MFVNLFYPHEGRAHGNLSTHTENFDKELTQFSHEGRLIKNCGYVRSTSDLKHKLRIQWRRHTRCVGAYAPHVRKTHNFLCLISELFRSVRKTCSCSIVKLVPPDVDFKPKMRQIRFPLGLCPRPRSGSLQHSPRRSGPDP